MAEKVKKTEDKTLKELKKIGKTLEAIKGILDKTWREIKPEQGG